MADNFDNVSAVQAAQSYQSINQDATVDITAYMSIDEYCEHINRNIPVRHALMNLNIRTHNQRQRVLGSAAAEKGDSRKVTPTAMKPEIVADINYTENYVKELEDKQRVGDETTAWSHSGNNDYQQRGQIYQVKRPLFYDDNNSGANDFSFADKITTSNPDNILYKTKRLFENKKINTIISRFHTEHAPGDYTSAKSNFGLSHGRNLLTKNAERTGMGYNTNGYNNPYCRVWTHHYKYDNLMKRIRPFYQDGRPLDIKDFHIWDRFSKDEGYGWKTGDIGWDLSVLSGNQGLPNIAPKFKGGGASNTHTKQCMFSIENLAWRGFDPYSFETALPWEQRGPNGGRIMWFPPYGISFTETTSTNWNNHTFIGRGEDVYTYANTQRTGTLNFMLVVDHPSIINYLPHDGTVSDTDVLRFFAGCSEIDGDGDFRNIVSPTPLTDEYIQIVERRTPEIEEPEPPEEEDPEVIEPQPAEEVTFYVFYPNNYSGVYDRPGGKHFDGVEAMAYLLAGDGAQMEYNSSNPPASKNIPITFEGLINSIGNGYEIGKNRSVTSEDPNNKIVCSAKRWAASTNSTKWVASSGKGLQERYYRMDGYYTDNGRIDKSEWNINTFDQIIDKNRWRDGNPLQLNSSIDNVLDILSKSDNWEKPSNFISFAEFAWIVASDNTKNAIEERCTIDKENETLKHIQELLDKDNNRKITEVHIHGFSNQHGKNNVQQTNDKRNSNLAVQRAESVYQWLQTVCDLSSVKISDIGATPSKTVNISDKDNVNGPTAKIWRSARVVLKFETSTTSTVAESDPEPIEDVQKETNYIGFTKYEDANGVYYLNDQDNDGRKWILDEKTGQMVYRSEVMNRFNGPINGGQYSNGVDINNIRYDQEYYFFKALKERDPLVFDKLMDKIQYFDPAFHSMTPEGFNARLTFLSQCMRQGNTLTISDANANGDVTQFTNNLAFGRAPYCVLRLGDFYNQMIVIDNISITYDPLQWDMNTEGIGMQPLLANVSISFKFIGGGDLGGPVRRLQNAMSFNYYANTRLYDNRADRVKYNWDDKTCGALDYEMDKANSVFHHVEMYKN